MFKFLFMFFFVGVLWLFIFSLPVGKNDARLFDMIYRYVVSAKPINDLCDWGKEKLEEIDKEAAPRK